MKYFITAFLCTCLIIKGQDSKVDQSSPIKIVELNNGYEVVALIVKSKSNRVKEVYLLKGQQKSLLKNDVNNIQILLTQKKYTNLNYFLVMLNRNIKNNEFKITERVLKEEHGKTLVETLKKWHFAMNLPRKDKSGNP